MVPNCNWKVTSGWTSHSCTVISHKNPEKEVGNRGSKSAICESITVKEQRINGSWCDINLLHLRDILKGYERNFIIKNLFNQRINKLLIFNLNGLKSYLNYI